MIIPKYSYPEKILLKDRKWPDKIITKSPIWCAVDLRDGNQALPTPMTPIQKMAYFKMLCKIGFKEIEVGFPSASKDDYDFITALIRKRKIPDSVRISVLTQARENLIAKTIDSIRGVKSAVVNCYLATSDLHLKLVFNKSRDEIIKIATEATSTIATYIKAGNLQNAVAYKFSPEEFSDSDLDFVIKLCEAVYRQWRKLSKNEIIINLPATVERRPPYQYADMIEYFVRNYRYTKDTTISVHTHNDQGCAVAASEMALLAGAQRVEGTLFGQGERTGNLDIVTLALNLQYRGIQTNLNFSDLPKIVKFVEKITGIPVDPRHPYAGSFAFSSLSLLHQNAIRKPKAKKNFCTTFLDFSEKVPNLHITHQL